MATIQGSKVVFQTLVGDDYKTVICAKAINIRTQADTKETTTKGDGRFKDFDYDQLTATVTLDSVIMMQNDDNPTHFDFLDQQYQFIEVNFRVIFTDSIDASKIKVFRAQAIVQDTATNVAAAQLVDGNLTLLVKGAWIMEDAVPEYTTLRIYTTGNNAASAQIRLQLVKLDTDDIIFDTAVKPEATAGWLENPLDATFDVLKDTYYWILEVRSETENNTWELNPAPGHSANFNNGVYVFNSKTELPGDETRAFEAPRTLTITLGAIVTPPECVDVAIVGAPALPDGQLGMPYSYSFAITGTTPFTLSNVTKPVWMDINIDQVNNLVIFTGTPDFPLYVGTDIPVSFDITNCSEGAVSFSDTIDVINSDRSVINYLITESDSGNAGTLRIYVNGVEQVTATPDSNGTIYANNGDTVQVTCSTTGLHTLSLVITDNTNIMYQSPALAQSASYTFTAGYDMTYNVSANIN